MQHNNEYNVTCRGIALSGHPTIEIWITDSDGSRRLSANGTKTIQQHSFYYNAEQHAIAYITGQTWINCTFGDDIGTYTKTEYINVEGELSSIVQ